jgi:hypothetical protein
VITPPPAIAQPTPEDWYDEIVVELRAERLARRSVHAFVENGVVLVPAEALFDLLEVHGTTRDHGGFHAVREPEGREISIDPSAGRVWIDGEEVPDTQGFLRQTSADLYIGTSLAARFLDVNVWVDLAELTVTLDPVDHLPLGRRVARERARAALFARSLQPAPDLVYGADVRSLHGAAIDWSLSVPNFRDLSGNRYRLSFGGGVLGGALNLLYRGAASGRRNAGAADRVEGSWLKAWPQRGWLRQMRLGTVLGTGPRPQSIRGLALSNSPFLRPIAFGQTVLAGQLRPGWEVELYRNGELLDFARVDERGFYELDTPLDYGQNPMELRAFGPHGEMVLLSRAIRVGADRIPAGTFEYEASIGDCATRDNTVLGNLDLRYGLSRWWTLRCGVEAFRRKGITDLVHPYGALSGTLSKRWSLRAEGVAGAFGDLLLSFEPTPDLRTSLAHTIFASGSEQPILHPESYRNRSRAGLFWRPLPSHRRLFLTLNTTRIEEAHGWQARGLLQASAQIGKIRWSAHWQESQIKRSEWSARSSLFGLSGSTVLHGRSLGFGDGLYMRGSVFMDTRRGAFDRASLALGKSLGKWGRLEVSSSWSGPDAEPRLSIGFTTDGAAFRSHNRVSRSTDGEVATSTYMDGSLVWNGAVGRLEPFSYRSTGRGGLSGTVFVDTNGNGWRDPTEEPVPDLRLRAGNRVVETDAQGRYSLWNLTPFEATDLELVASSLRNPLLIPQFELASVHVTPNGFREVNVPMVPGTEVMGHLAIDEPAGQEGIGGVRVSLRHLDSGKSHEAVTFPDGGFYFMALQPGWYEVSVDPELLTRMDLRLLPESRYNLIPAAGELKDAYGLEVRLVRRAPRSALLGWRSATPERRQVRPKMTSGAVPETEPSSPRRSSSPKPSRAGPW